MIHARFFSHNWIVQSESDFVFTTGQQDVFYPIGNLKLPHTTKIFRSPVGITQVVFYADLKALVPIDSILLVGHAIDNIKINSITAKGSGSTDFSTPLFEKTLELNNRYNFGHAFFEEKSCRYVEFTVSTTGDYVEISNIFIGKKTEIKTNNVDFGWDYKENDRSSIIENLYGNLFIDRYNTIKVLNLPFKLLNPQELEILLNIFDNHGKTLPVWFCLDAGKEIYNDFELFSGYFRFVDIPQIVNNHFQLFSCNIGLVQAI